MRWLGRAPTLLTGTEPPQVLVGIHARSVPVAPLELNGVRPHSVDRQGVDIGIERITGVLRAFQARSATAGPSQEERRIHRLVAVAPTDRHVRCVGTRDFDGYRGDRLQGRRPS